MEKNASGGYISNFVEDFNKKIKQKYIARSAGLPSGLNKDDIAPYIVHRHNHIQRR